MNRLSTIRAGSRNLELYSFTGEVVESQKWTTTRVSGGGGGGSTYNGTGYTSIAPVTSTTTTHDQIFIKASNGEERVLELSNVHLAVRRGQLVSLIWAIRRGKKFGPYVAVFNHNTSSLNFITKGLNDSCGPMLYSLWTVIAGLLLFTGALAVFGALTTSAPSVFAVPGIGYFLWQSKRRKRFKSGIDNYARCLSTN